VLILPICAGRTGAADAVERGIDLDAAGRTAESLLDAGLDPATALEAAVEAHDLEGLNEVEAADKIMAPKEWIG
jgi:hypothetical protein